MKKKNPTIPKTTSWCPLLWHFLQGNNIRPESKKKKKKNNPFSMYGNFSEKLTYIIP